MARKKPSTPYPHELSDLLTGRIQATSSELMALIRWVNPTGKPLSREERAARYADKAALQSLLLTQWGEHIDVVLDPVHRPDMVVLVHRLTGLDAGHARLSGLSGAAREVIDRRSADEVPVASEPWSPSPPTSVDPLANARRLLEEWDYDAAAAAFERAVTEVGLPAVHGWLDVAVDALGQDDRAVDVSRGWPDAIRFHPDVARRVAEAAVRCGRLTRARELVPHLALSDATAVWAALFRQALEEDDVLGAARLLLAIEADPGAKPMSRELRTLLVDHRRGAQTAFEGPLKVALERGVLDDIEREARGLLRRFADNPTATAAVRRVETERLALRRDQALLQAKRLESTGDLAGALRALDRAIAAGADVASRRADLSERLARRARRERVDAVCDALNRGGGLLEYARLKAVERDDVRQRVGRRALLGVEAALADRADAADAVRFAREVQRARTALLEGDPVEAVTALERSRYTPRWASARALLDEAREAARQQVASVLAARLDEAEAARDRGEGADAQPGRSGPK